MKARTRIELKLVKAVALLNGNDYGWVWATILKRNRKSISGVMAGIAGNLLR